MSINYKTGKGRGIVKEIMQDVQENSYGCYYFQAAILQRNMKLISSMLYNSEAWVNINEDQLRKLEQVDESLLQQILETPSTIPKEMLYLELGVLPIRFIITMKRLNYFYYLLHQPKESIFYQILKAQIENPKHNDWINLVRKDMENIGLYMSDINIEKM